ncbi:MAG: DUF4823 domain-containing protein [Pseudomonadota bacterium]
MRILFAALAAFVLTGCVGIYDQRVVTAPQTELEEGASVAVARPADGHYGDTRYEGSGRAAAASVRAAFAAHSDRVEAFAICQSADCLRGHTGNDFDYYAVPRILHWEERATEWSGRPDRIRVKLSVYAADRREPVASSIIIGESNLLTLGGDHPQDLLLEPITAYVDSLY